jgi:hypothetical protein
MVVKPAFTILQPGPRGEMSYKNAVYMYIVHEQVEL